MCAARRRTQTLSLPISRPSKRHRLPLGLFLDHSACCDIGSPVCFFEEAFLLHYLLHVWDSILLGPSMPPTWGLYVGYTCYITLTSWWAALAGQLPMENQGLCVAFCHHSQSTWASSLSHGVAWSAMTGLKLQTTVLQAKTFPWSPHPI